MSEKTEVGMPTSRFTGLGDEPGGQARDLVDIGSFCVPQDIDHHAS